MGQNNGDSCCGESGCCSSGHSEEPEMHEMMMDLAQEAWSEVMKERIKALIEKSDGAMIDRVAKASYEAAHKYHMGMMMQKAEYEQYKQKLKQAFSEK